MEASSLSTVLNLLKDIPLQCPMAKDLVRGYFRRLSVERSTCTTLPIGCSETFVAQTRVHSSSLSGCSRVDSNTYCKGLPAMLEGMGRLMCLKGCSKQCQSASKIAVFSFVWLLLESLDKPLVLPFHYFSFLASHHHHKVSHHSIILKLME